MTKEELKKLSDDTFSSNNQKQITAQGHRNFNNQLIDTMATQEDFDAYEIPDGAVTSNKLAEGAVTYYALDTDSVTTSAIDGEAVTTAKIANGAVTSDKLGSTALPIVCIGYVSNIEKEVSFIYNPQNISIVATIDDFSSGNWWNLRVSEGIPNDYSAYMFVQGTNNETWATTCSTSAVTSSFRAQFTAVRASFAFVTTPSFYFIILGKLGPYGSTI